MTGSDGIDFYGISRFDKNPLRGLSGLQNEIEQWQENQRAWKDAAPNAKAFFLLGNHEDRLRRYLWKHPELSDLEVLRLPSILGFANLGIEWEEEKGDSANKEIVLHDRILIKHGNIVRKFSGYTAKATMEQEFHSIEAMLIGHTHRGGSYFSTTRFGVLEAHEGFCLCDLNPEYTDNPNWQQGIVLIEVTDDLLSIEPIPFRRKHGVLSAVWRGKEYR